METTAHDRPEPSAASETHVAGLRLPNLLIAGVTKAGTTSLFNYLAAHPDVCPSSVKEPGYFSVDRRPGPLPPLASYAELVSGCADAPYRMEATPHYWMGGAPVIAAIKDTLDHPRVIILLRDPVARLWSLFTFYKSRGILDLAEPFEARIEIWEQEHRAYEAKARERPSALTSSMYVRYLSPWFDAFGEDLRIDFSERLSARPSETVSELYAWLGIDPTLASEQSFERHNPTVMPRNQSLAQGARALARRTNYAFRNYPAVRALLRSGYHRLNSKEQAESMSEQERARLQRWFVEPNRELGALLACQGYEDLPEWTRRTAPVVPQP